MGLLSALLTSIISFRISKILILFNRCDRTLISTTSKIEEKDISIINTSEEENLESLEAMEKKAIDKALNKYNKNYDLVAKVLGISINTLQNKLKHHHKLI